MGVIQPEVVFSFGGAQIRLQHQYILGSNLASPSQHIAGADKKESTIR